MAATIMAPRDSRHLNSCDRDLLGTDAVASSDSTDTLSVLLLRVLMHAGVVARWVCPQYLIDRQAA